MENALQFMWERREKYEIEVLYQRQPVLNVVRWLSREIKAAAQLNEQRAE